MTHQLLSVLVNDVRASTVGQLEPSLPDAWVPGWPALRSSRPRMRQAAPWQDLCSGSFRILPCCLGWSVADWLPGCLTV